MQCRDAQFYLRLRRHANDELGADTTAELDRHLTGCPQCARDSRTVLSFDRAVAAAMQSVAVPTGLRDALVTQALEFRGAVLRRQAYRLSALAASLFLTVGLVFGLFSASRPKLDTDYLAVHMDEQFQNPHAAIERWLTAQHLPASLPWQFNEDLLVSLGTEHLQGHDVPVIAFAAPNGRGFAKVYIFTKSGVFNTDPKFLRDAMASNTEAIVHKGQGAAQGLIYVVVFTGRDLDPFLHQPGARQPDRFNYVRRYEFIRMLLR